METMSLLVSCSSKWISRVKVLTCHFPTSFLDRCDCLKYQETQSLVKYCRDFDLAYFLSMFYMHRCNLSPAKVFHKFTWFFLLYDFYLKKKIHKSLM